MAARATLGASKQYWAVTTSATPQANGNIVALWVGVTGTLVLQAADGSPEFTLSAVPAGQWIVFPYAIQIVDTTSTATGIVAAGWGAATTG
jgi:hypothetical protein